MHHSCSRSVALHPKVLLARKTFYFRFQLCYRRYSLAFAQGNRCILQLEFQTEFFGCSANSKMTPTRTDAGSPAANRNTFSQGYFPMLAVEEEGRHGSGARGL
jgi:hypothetical protein